MRSTLPPPNDVTLALAQDPHLAEAHFVRAGLALRSMDERLAAAAQKGLKADPETFNCSACGRPHDFSPKTKRLCCT